MHEFAERGIASHWKYKSSEKVSHLALKEYDWLRDLVEIMEKDTSPRALFGIYQTANVSRKCVLFYS